MKKIALIALVVILALSLVACGRKDDNTTIPTTDRNPLPSTTPTTATNIPDPEVNDNSTDNNMDTDNTMNDILPDSTTDNNSTNDTTAK